MTAPIDLDDARRLAGEGWSVTTKPEDAAKNWAIARNLAALVARMAGEIERLRQFERASVQRADDWINGR